MFIRKTEKGTWEVRFYYKDYTGKQHQKHKTGFKTKKDAEKWAIEFKQMQSNNLDMTFSSFYKLYRSDMKERLRENTIITKDYIVELKIIPYFGNMKMTEITPAVVRRWQNSLMADAKDKYSPTYLKTINNQLNAIFNYAMKYYGLHSNPCAVAGTIGASRAEQMEYWTQDEFNKFIEAIADKEIYRVAFKVLFWTGCRLGELLALTLKDFNYSDMSIVINKSYQRIAGRDIVTPPKTPKSNRIVLVPNFLNEEMKSYVDKLYGIMPDDRLFMITKSNVEKVLAKGILDSGVKRIRVHDLRHSHASLLINELEAPPLLVAERLGHEKIETTLSTYSHLYPNKNRELADRLEMLMEDNDNAE